MERPELPLGLLFSTLTQGHVQLMPKSESNVRTDVEALLALPAIFSNRRFPLIAVRKDVSTRLLKCALKNGAI